MENIKTDWYKYWDLSMKNMSWVEDTERQVDFLIQKLDLCGSERILDLACGFGRHSLSFAKRGYKVVGVDITPELIEDAKKSARSEKLNAEFICSDIRNIDFREEFDVVLNMADGAVGYLENDEENLKIFDRISAALKPGGKHFMDICNREHAQGYFPQRSWDFGKKALTLSSFLWDDEHKRMLYWECNYLYGETVNHPLSIEFQTNGIRLYDKNELAGLFAERNMKIVDTYSDYSGSPDSEKKMQLMVYSRKKA